VFDPTRRQLCFLFFDCFSNSIAVLHISNAADAIFTAEQTNTTSYSSSYVAILGYFSHAHSKSAQLVAQQIHNKSHKWSLTKMATLIQGLDANLTNWPVSVLDFRVLWRSVLSARVPESQKL